MSSAENVFATGAKSQKSELETERDTMLKTIRELKVENDFLKKNNALKSVAERRKLIDPHSSPSKRAQCRVLGINRSGIYHINRGESTLNLELMRLMGMRYHYHPYKGAATDITYMPMPKGFMYLTAVIDLYSRFVLNWSVSNTMEAAWCAQMIEEAMSRYGVPEIVNTDLSA